MELIFLRGYYDRFWGGEIERKKEGKKEEDEEKEDKKEKDIRLFGKGTYNSPNPDLEDHSV